MGEEVWKRTTWSKFYEVSNMGRVRTLRTPWPRILVQIPNRAGQPLVRLYAEPYKDYPGGYRRVRVSTLMKVFEE